MKTYLIQKILYIVFLSLIIINGYSQSISLNKISVVNKKQAGAFPLVANGKACNIYFDTADAKVVQIAAQDFKNDIALVTGISPSVETLSPTASYSVIIGTIGKSKLVDLLIKNKKIDIFHLKNKWESFSISVVDDPFENVKQALVIAGSDSRGTAFGIFEVSRMMGVSPFYWWADVATKHQDEIYITKGSTIVGPPSVKYRGIFINDEDWGLQPWAAKTFEPEIGDIGPKTYAKVFELLLRLKANLIWPAMHPSTKAFYHYPGNKKMAADYSIIIGSSHAEPMLRNNVGEWDVKTMGDFNYITNKKNVYKYWEDRVKESSGNEAMYTLGMRGIHDSGIEGVKDAKDAVPLVENIFKDQREMLTKYLHKNITEIPQAFTAYKEVLEVYDNNLKLPNDVTLVWPDDNYGYIQRLNKEAESRRSGGSGIYYHASYWGRPHDYLWLSTTHPSLIREEMMKAYEMGTNKLWVLNVGDIKPLEYNIQLFLDMAFNAAPFKKSEYSKQHLLNWSVEIFGKNNAEKIKNILWQYYQLAFERRPEFMGWSQTEPTTKTNYTEYNHFFYGDEAQKRIDNYNVLENEVKALHKKINAKDVDAFYQLVYYPVVCASLMNKKFLYRDKSYLYSKQNRASAFDYALLAKQAYDSISAETNYYNTKLANGKWKNIMSMKPRDLPVYQELVIPEIKIDKSVGWSITPEGVVTKDSSLVNNNKMILPEFNRYNDQKYFIDIFLSDDKQIDWKASVSDNWIKLSNASGTLTPAFGKKQMRIWVSVDWNKISNNEILSGKIIFKAAGKEIVVDINANNVLVPELKNYKGFIESNGFVSMYASNYSKQINKGICEWKVIDGLGYTGKSIEAFPLQYNADNAFASPAWIIKNSPCVEYKFYNFTSAKPEVNIFSLPTLPLNKNFSVRYAVSVDDSPIQILDFKTVGRSEEWKQNVLRNSAIKKVLMPFISKGFHILKIYKIDPGVIIDRIVIDFGGYKRGYGLLPETKL